MVIVALLLHPASGSADGQGAELPLWTGQCLRKEGTQEFCLKKDCEGSGMQGASVTELFSLHPACAGPGLVEVSWQGLCHCLAVNPKLWKLPVPQLTGSVGKGLVRIRCNAESLLLLLCKIKPFWSLPELNLSLWANGFQTVQMWHLGTGVGDGLVGGLAGLRGLFQP